VRVGHSREEGVFEDLNVAQAKSIILATNDDLANLEMGFLLPPVGLNLFLSSSRFSKPLTALYKHIVQNVTSGLITIDEAGRVTSINRTAEEITGYKVRGGLPGGDRDLPLPRSGRIKGRLQLP
jgi:PAS domain-containing protein